MTIHPAPPIDLVLDEARTRMPCGPHTVAQTPVTARNSRIVNEWLTWMRDTAGRTRGTVYNYASVAAKYLDTCVGNRPMDAVSADEIETWLLRPRELRAKGRVAAPATRARNVAVLRSMYRWLHARNYVTADPTVLLVAPKVANRQPRAIPDPTWHEVWAKAPEHMRPMLGLGFFLGLRRAEMTNLMVGQVDPIRRQIVRFNRKGGGDDTLPYGEIIDVWCDFMPHLFNPWGPADFLASIENVRHYHSRLLAVEHPDHINRQIRTMLDDLGLPAAFTPHSLRHSFVTNLLRCGMPIEMVSGLANHSDISVTMRYVKGGGGRVAEWRKQSLASQTVSLSDWR